MEAATLEMFKNMLEAQLNELTTSVKVTVNELITQYNFDTDHSDPLDRASVDINQNFLLRIRDRESRLIIKIKMALSRIEDGSYGTCESCGEDIAIERLMARPVATYCISCKRALEIAEKHPVNYQSWEAER